VCTLIVFKDMKPGHPLIVAANRDEIPGRPTADPDWIAPDTYAPQDLVHGGSWIGVNRRGMVAALTNNYPFGHQRGRRSRGLIVTESLRCESINWARVCLFSAQPRTYNGFHLLLADGKNALVIWSDGEKYHEQELGPGFHIITGDGYGPGHSYRDLMIRGFLAAHGNGVPDRRDIDKLLSFHGPGSADGTCVHGEDVSKETLFSMVIDHNGKGMWAEIDWRTGRPCEQGPWRKEEIEFRR